MLEMSVWIVLAGCFAIGSPQGPAGFHLPALMHVDRNWYIMSSEPNGTYVTKAYRERRGNERVTWGLETSGPPVPFSIDPDTGVVFVNDTLNDKENRSYSLWVTASDGFIPQRTEVYATITDKSGQRRNPPHPALPFFPTARPKPHRPFPGFELQNYTTATTTKVTEDYTEEETVPDTTSTTLSPPKPPDDIPKADVANEDKNTSSVKNEEATPNDGPLTVIPLVAISGLVVIVAGVMFFIWKKNQTPKASSKKEDMSKDSSGIVLQDASLNMWDRPRAYSNRYESWDNGHLQLAEETSISKEQPVDEWEFPRHRLRIFNIVGEGAFGQVWRAQAIDIDAEETSISKEQPVDEWEFPRHRLRIFNIVGEGAFGQVWRAQAIDIDAEETSISKEQPVDEWEFPRHRLRIFNIVGEGAFGQVWRAQAIDIDGKKGETTVAVKTLKENASEKEKTDLIQELTVMKSLETHPNVVRLIACCTEKEPTLVIMEFVSLGKLQQFLRNSRAERHYGNTHGGSQFLTSRDLTHFAFQVARGMDFLSSKGIIHRDLAARNVLITEERTCKVADFGFARDVAGTHVYERKSDGRLPIRWMAPESLYDDIFSVKSDIWSFGVLLWEIVTLGSTPYPGLSAGDVMRKVREGHRLEKPEHCRRELYNIMYYCWEADATSRPDFKEVVSMLERLLCTEMDYIELERFPDHSYYNVQHLEGEKL